MTPVRLRAAMAAMLLCAASGTYAAPAPTVPSFASLIASAREQLQDQRYVEALASAKNALRVSGADYTGHYYVAMAYLGMERFDDAENAAMLSLARAPDSARAALEKLSATIQQRRQGKDVAQSADAALADGMAGNAARLYEQGWNAGQVKPELGMKAAELYANRLNQPSDAARILRQISAAAKDQPAGDHAEQQLKKLAPVLRAQAQSHLEAARKQSGAEAARSLQLAEQADPTLADIYVLRAQTAAAGDDLAALQKAVKELSRRDLAQPAAIAALPRIERWMAQPEFVEFLGNLIGGNRDAVVQLLSVRQEQQKKVDQQAEDGVWQAALGKKTRAALQAYLARFPNGSHATEAAQRLDLYLTQPPRPEVPLALGESVWRALEASAGYRNAAPMRWIQIRSLSETVTEIQGVAPRKMQHRRSISFAPISEKCWVKTETSQFDIGQASTSTTYFCAGIPLAVLGADGNVQSQLSSLQQAGDGRLPGIGASFTINYVIAMHVGERQNFPIASTCRYEAPQLAASLNPQLEGNAWPVKCSAAGHPDGNDILLEKLGLMVSEVGTLNVAAKRYVMPYVGYRNVMELNSLLSPNYRSTETFMEYSIVASDHAPGRIGVHMLDVSKEQSVSAGLAAGRGVYIPKVISDAPAARAGIENGDIVLQVNGVPVNGQEALRSAISAMLPGSDARLTVWRKQVAREVAVVVGE